MPAEPHSSLYALDDWTVLSVSGANAPDFLHGQFTNDLLALPDDQAQLSAYCMPKGQMIANFLVWRTSREPVSDRASGRSRASRVATVAIIQIAFQR